MEKLSALADASRQRLTARNLWENLMTQPYVQAIGVGNSTRVCLWRSG
ncbi:hypothetical protein AwEntero_15160 [Enterobacterales bacterium]|nr:hypothetical protein AwEntero_15160 [Enterobacterales bacterium]